MEVLAAEVRRLVYTVICFQCLIQLTEGSAYQKYLKLFSYLLTMCICCNVVFTFVVFQGRPAVHQMGEGVERDDGDGADL